MTKLRLVPNPAPEADRVRFCMFMEAFSDSLSPECTLDKTLYGRERLLSWLLEVECMTDQIFEQIEIIYDPDSAYKTAQGIHAIVPHSCDELDTYIEGALSDGFKTIFIHLKH